MRITTGTPFGVVLALAAVCLLNDISAQPLSQVSTGSCASVQVTGAPSQEKEISSLDKSREMQIRKLFRKNMSWATGHSMGTRWYKWPNSRGVKKVFGQLTEADIPVLISMICSYEDISPYAIHKGDEYAEYNSAIWVLSFFKEKAEAYVRPLYEAAQTEAEKEKWRGVLGTIEVRKIEASESKQ